MRSFVGMIPYYRSALYGYDYNCGLFSKGHVEYSDENGEKVAHYIVELLRDGLYIQTEADLTDFSRSATGPVSYLRAWSTYLSTSSGSTPPSFLIPPDMVGRLNLPRSDW